MISRWKTWRAMRHLARVRFFVWRVATIDADVERFIVQHLSESTAPLAPVVAIRGGTR